MSFDFANYDRSQRQKAAAIRAKKKARAEERAKEREEEKSLASYEASILLLRRTLRLFVRFVDDEGLIASLNLLSPAFGKEIRRAEEKAKVHKVYGPRKKAVQTVGGTRVTKGKAGTRLTPVQPVAPVVPVVNGESNAPIAVQPEDVPAVQPENVPAESVA